MEKLTRELLNKIIAFLISLLSKKRCEVIEHAPIEDVPKPVELPRKSRIEEWAHAIERYENANPLWNNPGAIRSLSGAFLKFKTREEGFAYLCDYLRRACTGKHKAYPKGGEHTLYEFQCIYSPREDKNDPLKYAQYIANELGVTISTKIKELL